VKRYVFAPLVGVVIVAASSGGAAAPTTDAPTEGCVTPGDASTFGGRASLEARARLAACVSAACPRAVHAQCARELAATDARLPAVMLAAEDEASNGLSAVRVTMDGKPLLDRLGGAATVVDPGEHRFTFEADGFRPTETTAVLHERERLRVLVFLDRSGAPGGGPSTTVPAASTGRWQRDLGLALGGASIGGVAVGVVWAVMSKATYEHAIEAECGGGTNGCSAQGIADGQTAHDQATVATAGFAAAGALLAAGAALYLFAPKHGDVVVVPAVAQGGGAVALAGRW
jgi:hypothetical protein